jgi:hypothetical protein
MALVSLQTIEARGVAIVPVVLATRGKGFTLA